MPTAKLIDKRTDNFTTSGLEEFKTKLSDEIEDLFTPLDEQAALPTFTIPGKHLCLVNDVVTKHGLNVDKYLKAGYEFVPKESGYNPAPVSLAGQTHIIENYKAQDSVISVQADRNGMRAFVMMIDEKLWLQRENKSAHKRIDDLKNRATTGAMADGFTVKEYSDLSDTNFNRK